MPPKVKKAAVQTSGGLGAGKSSTANQRPTAPRALPQAKDRSSSARAGRPVASAMRSQAPAADAKGGGGQPGAKSGGGKKKVAAPVKSCCPVRAGDPNYWKCKDESAACTETCKGGCGLKIHEECTVLGPVADGDNAKMCAPCAKVAREEKQQEEESAAAAKHRHSPPPVMQQNSAKGRKNNSSATPATAKKSTAPTMELVCSHCAKPHEQTLRSARL